MKRTRATSESGPENQAAIVAPPLHLIQRTAALIAADLLGQPRNLDRQLVALRLVEFLTHANAHPKCPPPADETEAAEREHLGCVHCGTGIYCLSRADHG
ncbi:hypothetical protein [Cupriavidus pauculus]|uniref:hypothetical protein n=1 Tax=Cupriavidus pauculus TaxID=82633 RepID=UPI001FD1DE81|nr:hypothetical protein [Cupriavidus pauculus]